MLRPYSHPVAPLSSPCPPPVTPRRDLAHILHPARPSRETHALTSHRDAKTLRRHGLVRGTRRAFSPGMTRYRNRLPIAALILAGASVLAPTRAAIAQGALATRAREIAPAPADESVLQPARSVLHQRVGRWRFAIW